MMNEFNSFNNHDTAIGVFCEGITSGLRLKSSNTSCYQLGSYGLKRNDHVLNALEWYRFKQKNCVRID